MLTHPYVSLIRHLSKVVCNSIHMKHDAETVTKANLPIASHVLTSVLFLFFLFSFFLVFYPLHKRKRDFFWQKEIETRVWWTAHSPIPINWQRQPFGEIEPFSEWIVEPLIFKWVLASLQDILLFKSLLGRRKWHLLSGGITTSNTLREIIWRRSELSTLFMV